MEAKYSIAIAAVYATIYVFGARALYSRLGSVDPDLFSGLPAKDMFSVSRMIFDERLPKEGYPVWFKVAMRGLRIMLYLYPLVLIWAFFVIS
ncbi:hypothetical protein RKE25_05230 [Dyella sp. BiH032]|uniref:hypothetical protein n=1 Tax=Dyella sp. BiH032 TaxID=3075430 RepID=UPI002892E78B|nr:hypothetical protein [Dyella sp. BiH032]WNL47042.1 hypothetical protein RKE25_05230 [Dyella sp. BiH032]